MTTDTLAKEAAEQWAREVQGHLAMIVSGSEGIVRALDAYADIPVLAESVRDALLAVKDIITANTRLTGTAETIVMMRGLQIAAEALRGSRLGGDGGPQPAP